jgi:peptidyl-prolyl cis-trans isomerase D
MRPVANGVGRIVFRVVSVEVPPMPATDSQRAAQISAGLQDDLLVQYVLRLQNELGVHVNETALRTVTGDVGS